MNLRFECGGGAKGVFFSSTKQFSLFYPNQRRIQIFYVPSLDRHQKKEGEVRREIISEIFCLSIFLYGYFQIQFLAAADLAFAYLAYVFLCIFL